MLNPLAKPVGSETALSQELMPIEIAHSKNN